MVPIRGAIPTPLLRARPPGTGDAWSGAHDADRTRDLVLTKDVLYQLSYVGLFLRHPPFVNPGLDHPNPHSLHRLTIDRSTPRLTPSSLWSGRWDLNPRQPAWKAGTLPLSYARLTFLLPGCGFPSRPQNKLAGSSEAWYGGQARIRTLEDISQQIYSLPPLATWVPARAARSFSLFNEKFKKPERLRSVVFAQKRRVSLSAHNPLSFKRTSWL
jgi:hypothetical protein